MMGASKKLSRSDLVRMKASGDERAFSQWVQDNLLARGHEVEELARPHVEADLGEDLYPATLGDGAERYLASFDGVTMDGETGFEHKLWNEELATAVRAKAAELPGGHHWQLEQQILVGGLKRVIFVVSDGTRTKRVQMTYEPVPGRAAQLEAGWRQFDEDVANYQHVEVLPKAVPEAVRDLPAILIDVKVEGGEIAIVSSLAKFGEQLKAYLAWLPVEPKDDQDFANLEQAVKRLDEAERALKAGEAQALARFTTVDEMRSTVAMLVETARAQRLHIGKLVDAKKASIRDEIRVDGLTKYGEHITLLNKRLGGAYLPVIAQQFAEVMKGKKTLASLRDAVATELARLKIVSNEVAERIDANLKLVRGDENKAYLALFPDLTAICGKPCEDFMNLVAKRIADQKALEQKRLDDERERIRLEEEAKARAKVEAERIAAMPAAVVAVPKPTPSTFTPPLSYDVRVDAGPLLRPPPPRGRPADHEIIDVLAEHYEVPRDTVIDWLIEIDFSIAA